MITVEIFRSSRKAKKYMALYNGKNVVHFGARGFDDFTTHKDPERKERYITRHAASGRENWGREGLYTAGFLSRWVLWETQY